MLALLKKKILSSLLLVWFYPAMLYAQFDGAWAFLLLKKIYKKGIKPLIPILVGIAFLIFIWGVVQFVATDEDSKRSEGKRKIAWGLVGLFVIVSVWGLVSLIQTLVGVENRNVNPPQDWFPRAEESKDSALVK